MALRTTAAVAFSLLAAASAALAQNVPGAGGRNAVASDSGVQRMARELIPAVERAVGLPFKRPPVVALRTRDQVHAYLDRKIAQELPPAELAASGRAYRAFGLLPDTTDLRRLMLDLYSEQVAGFYDPDSAELYVVRGADPLMVRAVLAHELVHALQDQYTPLNTILKLRRQNDRQMAGQAMAEGQATVAGLQAMFPGADLSGLRNLQQSAREGMRAQQEAMPVFANAPRLVQEDLLFPYLFGAGFITGFDERRRGADEQPWGARVPLSTEQILHPSKYTARERPVAVAIAAPAGDTLVYGDTFGEFDVRISLEVWGAAEDAAIVAASGWNGDRFALLGDRTGTALVWATAWDTPADAQEFANALAAGWRRRTGAVEGPYAVRGGAGRRWKVDRLMVAGVPVVRLTDAPAAWPSWSALPAARVTR